MLLCSLVGCGTGQPVSSGSSGFEPSHAHYFTGADCTTPGVCVCGANDGKPLGHRWGEASCISPKICTVCRVTEGAPLGHHFVDGVCTRCRSPKEPLTGAKPVIYLYPETDTDVSVRLDWDGELTCTYPAYNDGWRVTAQPDGTLTDAAGKTYNYLYWEGETDTTFDMRRGPRRLCRHRMGRHTGKITA